MEPDASREGRIKCMYREVSYYSNMMLAPQQSRNGAPQRNVMQCKPLVCGQLMAQARAQIKRLLLLPLILSFLSISSY